MSANFCTTQQLHYPFADVAVLSSENTSDKKSIVHTLSLKEGFWLGMYKARSFGGIAERKKVWQRINIFRGHSDFEQELVLRLDRQNRLAT